MRKSALFWFGLVVTALVALGLIVLSSASEANAMRYHHGDAYFFMRRQFEYLVVGILVVVAVARFDYHKWRDHEFLSWAFFAIVFALLIAVLFSRAINGSHRWLSVGPVRLQPSELAKLAVILSFSVFIILMAQVWYDVPMTGTCPEATASMSLNGPRSTLGIRLHMKSCSTGHRSRRCAALLTRLKRM